MSDIKLAEGAIDPINVTVGETKPPIINYTLENSDGETIGSFNIRSGTNPGFCIEDLLNIAKHRLETVNSELHSEYNDLAIDAITLALDELNNRRLSMVK